MLKEYLDEHTVAVLVTGGSLGTRGLWSPCLWRTVDHKHADDCFFPPQQKPLEMNRIHAR